MPQTSKKSNSISPITDTKITKKNINNTNIISNLNNILKDNKTIGKIMNNSGLDISMNSGVNKEDLDREIRLLKMELKGEHHIEKHLGISETDFKNISPDTVKRILELLQNYVNMDKSFRLKHDTLKTLYQAYLDLYKKYQSQSTYSGTGTTPTTITTNSLITTTNNLTTGNGNGNGASQDKTLEKQGDMLKTIHNEMKENNSNLYKERLIILKKIKETPEIDHVMKNKLCGRLIAIFKAPPVPEYKPLQLLRPAYEEQEKISVGELDNAYLQKHNELMTVYKAYQNLYNKVLNYKEQLNKYRTLPTGSNISRCEMEKMIKDQRFVMDMIDKMQNNLANNKIIDETEKVLITPVASNPDNMNAFSNTMRDQIKQIIDRQLDLSPNTKSKIENLLQQYRECDSNDTFCKAGREILLLKKL